MSTASAVFENANVNVIFAEDEFVFREIAIPSLYKAGFSEEQVHVAEDGLVALQHLRKLQDECRPTPILMLLDLRMPNMDGNECAVQVVKLVENKELRFKPFMVCVSSAVSRVLYEQSDSVFHMKLPKPLTEKEIAMCMEKLRSWWTRCHANDAGHVVGGDSAASLVDSSSGLENASPAAAAAPASVGEVLTDLGTIDIIIADDEMICRLAIVTTLGQAGASSQAMTEVDDLEEAAEILQEAQGGNSERPLCVFLGDRSWLDTLRSCVNGKSYRDPFFVLRSVGTERITEEDGFHAILPHGFKQDGVKAILHQCGAWHLQHKS